MYSGENSGLQTGSVQNAIDELSGQISEQNKNLGVESGTMTIANGAAKEDVLAQAKETLASRLEGKTVVKEIYVPGKIVNLIVK